MSKTNLAYGAEVLGTFFLSLAVLVAINSNAFIPEAVAILAGAVLGICVYTIGPISGCHINPAITLGLLTIKKIDLKNALGYILAQVFGAGLAIVFSSFLLGSDTLSEVLPFNIATFVAEAFGTFFFAFGIAAVVLGKAKEQMSGIVIGGSLSLGVLLAVLSGSQGILNPAVAFALNSVSIVYLLAPIVGAVLGFHVYKFLSR